MMRVAPAPEPAAFDSTVRQPGLRALERLAGDHGGAKDAIPASRFPPYWRRSLEDLLAGYGRICSYLCLYIPRGTGARSVDHMIPKSTRWDQTYEWLNYRLACSLMNARKNDASSVLDPFDVEDEWFVLELVAFQVLPADSLAGPIAESVERTIERLRLNDAECCEAREEYAEDYWRQEIALEYLVRHAPFVANELRRQSRLRAADAES